MSEKIQEKTIIRLPQWFTDDLVTPLKAGIAHEFILHGDINGLVANPDISEESDEPYISVKKFLEKIFDKREMVIFYNIASGVSFSDSVMEKEFKKINGLDGSDISGDPVAVAKAGLTAKRGIPREPELCLPLIEKVLKTKSDTAVVIQSVHFIAPAGNGVSASFPNERANIERFKNWSRDEEFRSNGNIILLFTEEAAKVSPELRESGGAIKIIFIPKPDKQERKLYIESLTDKNEKFKILESRLKKLEKDLKKAKPKSPRYGKLQEKVSALNKDLKISAPLFFVPDSFETDIFVHAAQGMNLRQIFEIFLHSKRTGNPLSLEYVKDKKREILNAEYGEVMEVVEPQWGLEYIGGLDYVKGYLKDVILSIKKAETRLVPMGILLMGPPGTGKTAIVEALAKEAGFNFVKTKNIRSMWVGESEARMEKQIYGLKVLAPVVVMNDEADLAEAQRDSAKGDSGVSERLMKMWMELLSDPKIRGQIIVISCTNRPDRIDPALKRSGRTDERILIPPPSIEGRKEIFNVAFKRHNIPTSIGEFNRFAKLTADFSGADIVEKIVPTSFRFAVSQNKKEVDEESLIAAIRDTISSASQAESDKMTLLGILESSSRRLLPPNIKEIILDIKSRNLVENLAQIIEQIEERGIVNLREEIDLENIMEEIENNVQN